MLGRHIRGAYQRLPAAKLDQRWQRARMSRSIVRFLCFGLIFILVTLMTGLVRMSHDSARMVDERLAAKEAGLDWHKFDMLQKYYRGLRYLRRERDNVPEYPPRGKVINITKPAFDSYAYSPYPKYDSREYLENFEPVKECFLFKNSTVRIPAVHSYRGVPSGMPDPLMGSYEVLGLEGDTCFDRYGRFGPYGYGYSIKHGGSGLGLEGYRVGAEKVWEKTTAVDWTDMDWGDAQDRCVMANEKRFTGTRDKPKPLPGSNAALSKGLAGPAKRNRTAIVIRTWHKYEYHPEDIMNLRALIAELSILSGGEYNVHFLVHVKDENLPIWASDAIYRQVLKESVPREFQGLATLWSEKQMSLIYPGLNDTMFVNLPIHGVSRSSFMPMQYFAAHHPEYAFFWNWELDVRYTGHFYELFERLAEWSRSQPRKGLWERSGRFYMPSKHGTWQNFTEMVKLQTERLSLRKGFRNPTAQFVWGPVNFPGSESLDREEDPKQPWELEQDRNEWGVGEDADVITLNPIFNVDGSGWGLAEDTTGYNNWDFPQPPRRAAIVATLRLSRRILLKMHMETAIQRHSMSTEMWPISVALHHGLKTVYAPHPFYVDRAWPLDYADQTLNGGKDLVPGGSSKCIFGEGQIHNLLGTSWYYNAYFPQLLWRRWLGFLTDDKGGEQYELGEESGGRMCLRSMLLHPVKDG